MATESADGSDISVSLPPMLEEWVDERAASLGVDRDELLIQVVGAYRAAADLDDGDLSTAIEDDGELDTRIETAVDTQLSDHESELAAMGERIEDLEEDLQDDLESVRNRVLQLRDAVRNRAKTDHTHEEFGHLSDRLDAIATDVADLSDELAETRTQVADARSKLNTLARIVLELKNDGPDPVSERRRHLEQLRTTANRRGVTEGTCHNCGESVSVSLLSDPSCPHCDAELRDVSTTGILFTRATLLGPDPEDEAEGRTADSAEVDDVDEADADVTEAGEADAGGDDHTGETDE